MQAEFEVAIEDKKPFVFAIGCLIAAWREMVKHSEGRLVFANYALAFGLFIPMAALNFRQVIEFATFPSEIPPFGMLGVGAGPNPYLTLSQNSAVPVLLVLWLLLGMAHLRLAWVLIEGDWSRVVEFGALIGAATITLCLFTSVLMLDLSPLTGQVAGLGVEIAAILVSARWDARLVTPAWPDLLVR